MDNEEKDDSRYCACVWCGNWISKDAYFKRVERKPKIVRHLKTGVEWFWSPLYKGNPDLERSSEGGETLCPRATRPG